MNLPRAARLLALVALPLLLCACDPSRLAQTVADRTMSAQDKALVGGFFADVRDGHLDAARQRFTPVDAPDPAELAELRQLLACCGPPRLVSFNARKVPDRPWRLDMDFLLGHGHDAHGVGFRITGAPGDRRLARFRLGHSADIGAAMSSALRWTGAAAALLLGLTAMLVWRRRRRRRP